MCIEKNEWVDWINEYGYNEGCIRKEMTSHQSGHLCLGSAMETDDSCGNCDGAKCDRRSERYQVTLYGMPKEIPTDFGWSEWMQPILETKTFSDKTQAIRYYESL